MRHYRQNTAGKQKILMVQNSRIRIFALNNSHLHPTSNLFILIIELQFKYCHVTGAPNEDIVQNHLT